MGLGHAVLEGHEVVEVPFMDPRWVAMWKAKDARRVAFDEVGDAQVSTVFLAMDHQYGDGPSLWFETMAFMPCNQPCWRYATWDRAEAGHRAVVEALREGRSLDDLDIEP